tara:strand:- start:6 stop:1013 length:1008 start_codon:yes stop_codon:yes gene_type:complete
MSFDIIAKYGLDGIYQDVSKRINELLSQGSAEFIVTNEKLRVTDDHPGKVKNLIVMYENIEYTFSEQERVVLPPPSPDVTQLAIFYSHCVSSNPEWAQDVKTALDDLSNVVPENTRIMACFSRDIEFFRSPLPNVHYVEPLFTGACRNMHAMQSQQILSAIKASKKLYPNVSHVFFTEHDCLFPPSHFVLTAAENASEGTHNVSHGVVSRKGYQLGKYFNVPPQFVLSLRRDVAEKHYLSRIGSAFEDDKYSSIEPIHEITLPSGGDWTAMDAVEVVSRGLYVKMKERRTSEYVIHMKNSFHSTSQPDCYEETFCDHESYRGFVGDVVKKHPTIT